MKPASLRTLLLPFFSSLKKNGIRFCVLRDYENLPDSCNNDVDILVARVAVQKTEQLLLSIAEENGYALHMRAEHSCLMLVFHDRGNPNCKVHIDLHTQIMWRGFQLIKTQKILDTTIPYNSFFTPSPPIEHSINLLMRLLYHGKIRQNNFDIIVQAAISETCKDHFFEELQTILGRFQATIIFKHLVKNDINALEKRRNQLRIAVILKNITHTPLHLIVNQKLHITRLVRRLKKTTGLCVAIIGPDGTGKSTIAKHLCSSMSDTFSKDPKVFHLRPLFFNSSQKETSSKSITPYTSPPRNRILSKVFMFYHTMMFSFSYWVKIHPLLLKGHLVVLDRYYLDLLADPARFRLNIGKKVLSLGKRFVPSPHIVFLLDAPAKIIQQRKSEVSEDLTNQQRLSYQLLKKQFPEIIVINTDGNENSVADSLVLEVLTSLVKKTKHSQKITRSDGS